MPKKKHGRSGDPRRRANPGRVGASRVPYTNSTKDYDEFRQNVAQSLMLDEHRAATTYTKANIRQLEHQESPGAPERKTLSALREAFGDFAFQGLRTLELSVDRSVLIEQQIDEQLFIGPLHEQYHQTSGDLRTSYHAAVQAGKRVANASAHFLGATLPPRDRNGLRVGSFGKLFGATERLLARDDLTVTGRAVLEHVRSHGEYFELVVHEYRDKVLEHANPESSLDLGNLVTKDDRVELLTAIPGTTPTGEANLPAGAPIDPRWNGAVRFDRLGHDGQYVYHVHVHLYPERANLVAAGDPIGFTTDANSGHFDRHGEHRHEFTSPVFDHSEQSTPPALAMPGVGELIGRYVLFVTQLLLLLKDIPVPDPLFPYEPSGRESSRRDDSP